MEKKNELGPLIPGMVFEDEDKGTIELRLVKHVFWPFCGGERLPRFHLSFIEPIPITPEILRDWFGFKATGDPIEFITTFLDEYKIHREIRVRLGKVFTTVKIDGTYLKVCNKAHELQRLLAGLGLEHTIYKSGR